MHPFAGRFGLLAHLQRWLAGGRAWRFHEVLLHSAGVRAPDAGAAPHLHPSRVPGCNWPLTRSFPSLNCLISGDRLGTGVFSLCALARLRALSSLRQVWLPFCMGQSTSRARAIFRMAASCCSSKSYVKSISLQCFAQVLHCCLVRPRAYQERRKAVPRAH